MEGRAYLVYTATLYSAHNHCHVQVFKLACELGFEEVHVILGFVVVCHDTPKKLVWVIFQSFQINFLPTPWVSHCEDYWFWFAPHK